MKRFTKTVVAIACVTGLFNSNAFAQPNAPLPPGVFNPFIIPPNAKTKVIYLTDTFKQIGDPKTDNTYFDIYSTHINGYDKRLRGPNHEYDSSYTIPKNTPLNKPALDAALKVAIAEEKANEEGEKERQRLEEERKVREANFIKRAQAVNKVSVDPITGAWDFEYMHSEYDPESENPYTEVEFRKRKYYPPNLIDPKIKSNVKEFEKNQFEYRYTIENGKKAKQNLIYVSLSNGLNLTTWAKPDFYSPELDRWNKEQIALCNSRMIRHKELGVISECSEGGNRYIFTAFRLKTWEDPNNGSYRVLYAGLKPGQRWDNIRMVIPFVLPGIAFARIEGDNNLSNPNDWGAPSEILEIEGEAKTKLTELLNSIGKETPVLSPMIKIPQPYNGAVLAGDIKAEVQRWIEPYKNNSDYAHQTGNELIKPEALALLNRQFDLLIPALERKDKLAVRQAVKSMFEQLFIRHGDLDHLKFDQDDEQHDTRPKRDLSISADAKVTNTAMVEPLHRVAARALGFNLMYILKQSEAGK